MDVKRLATVGLIVASVSACLDSPGVDLSSYPSLIPGAEQVSMRRLEPFEARYNAGPDEIVITVDTMSGMGERSASFVSTLRVGDGRVFTDQVVLSLDSGLPVNGRSPIRGGRAELSVTYDGTHVVGDVLSSDSAPRSFECTVPVPVYSGVGLALVLTSLPLEVGYRVKVPMLRRSDCSVFWIPVTVVRQEKVRGPAGGEFVAWVVEADRFGRYWLTPDPPYSIRRELASGTVQELLSYSME